MKKFSFLVPDTRYPLSCLILAATIFVPLGAILIAVMSGFKLHNLNYESLAWVLSIGLLLTFLTRKLDVYAYKDVEADMRWRKYVHNMTDDELHDYFKRRNFSITSCMKASLARLPSSMREEIEPPK